MIKLYLVLAVLIVNVRCKSAQRLIVSRGEPFTFDCQNEESVYFARRLDHWSEVSEGSDLSLSLNLKFDYLSQKKSLRVNVDAAQPENVGYYGCRKASWSSTEMNRVYQLILAGNIHPSLGGRTSIAFQMLNPSTGRMSAMVQLVPVAVRTMPRTTRAVLSKWPNKREPICTAVPR